MTFTVLMRSASSKMRIDNITTKYINFYANCKIDPRDLGLILHIRLNVYVTGPMYLIINIQILDSFIYLILLVIRTNCYDFSYK